MPKLLNGRRTTTDRLCRLLKAMNAIPPAYIRLYIYAVFGAAGSLKARAPQSSIITVSNGAHHKAYPAAVVTVVTQIYIRYIDTSSFCAAGKIYVLPRQVCIVCAYIPLRVRTVCVF